MAAAPTKEEQNKKVKDKRLTSYGRPKTAKLNPKWKQVHIDGPPLLKWGCSRSNHHATAAAAAYRQTADAPARSLKLDAFAVKLLHAYCITWLAGTRSSFH